MKLSRHIFLLPVCILFYTIAAIAQPGFNVDIEKPAPYKERKLKAEKTGEGKLKTSKRVLQNLTTRFNYYFNASNKFNEIIERAKTQHKDDYAQLLSFYSYDLNATAADSAQLDSVIYKVRTGIVNHDLRNEWIDELYLLWAASFHLQKKFDSASMLLQFINYAYAPKTDDGSFRHIGTNNPGAKEVSIATREDKKLLHSNTFSRNNAFLWQIRTRTEMDDITGAGSLITTLKKDPNFPKHLGNGLDEVEAYWWYRQQQWDSAAVHLLAAIDGSNNKMERARWHYLAAQMREKAGNTEEASKLYEKVAAMTPDPVMEVYARLNMVRLSKVGGQDATDKNLAELLKMARRDKYEEYRDIIYYMAAQMELERGNIAAASELLIKGAKSSTGDQASKNKAFLKIADVLYDQKKYLQSASFYDSVQVTDLAEADAARVGQRKTALQKVVLHSGVVSRQDSLQRIAALPEDERNALVKATVKKLRKQQGLKDDATAVTGGTAMLGAGGGAGSPPTDLFQSQKGEWYFYNTNLRSQGTAQFKAVWGNRPNTDNWRRFSVVSQQAMNQPDRSMDVPDPNGPGGATDLSAGNDLSVEGLTSRLPLTPEAIKTSNDSISRALFELGTAYLNEIEDLPTAIATFEELRRRFPENEKSDEVLFNLFYAYSKTGNQTAAAQAKQQLTNKYPASRFASIAATGKDPLAKTDNSAAATKAYENVYNLFIEGRFSEAESAKKIADSTYKTTFWQPQLLYIESVYYIRQRDDSVAKTILQTIVRQNTHKGLTAKAQNLLSVLDRRKQIEEELTNLQITRPGEDDTATSKPAVALQAPPVKKDTAVVAKPVVDPAKDSAALAKIRQKQLSDSLAQKELIAKRLRDSIETARKDSIALAKKQADQALQDALAQKALADKKRTDSIATAKKEALALKALADKQKRDSIATAKLLAAEARRDSLARKALADQQRKDSLATAKAARDQARRDSIALREALAKQASDSAALRKYFEKRERDSIARVTRDSIALAKKQAAQAAADLAAQKTLADKQRRDSLAAAKNEALALKALVDKQKRDSIALVKLQAEEARKDSLARKALATKQRTDSLNLARQRAAELRRDSLALKALADQQRRDSIAAARAARDQARRDSIAARQAEKRMRDSLAQRKPTPQKPVEDPASYFYEPGKPHYAIVILDKVDPIFVNEARNAFSRYNREQNGGQPLEVQIVNITAETRLLVISGLQTAAAAADYVTTTKALAATEIIPWLKGDKYTFSIISARNLDLLKTKTDVPAYKQFLEQHLPGKF